MGNGPIAEGSKLSPEVIESIAGKMGCTAEQQRIKDLEREVRELRQTNEILQLTSAAGG